MMTGTTAETSAAPPLWAAPAFTERCSVSTDCETIRIRGLLGVGWKGMFLRSAEMGLTLPLVECS